MNERQIYENGMAFFTQSIKPEMGFTHQTKIKCTKFLGNWLVARTIYFVVLKGAFFWWNCLKGKKGKNFSSRGDV